MSISKIGSSDRVTRDAGSTGLDAQDKLAAAEGKKLNAKPPRNEKVDEVAKMYEKNFLREMVKAMRSTVSYGADKPGMAENIYKDQLDDQYVESWGEQGGIGLANLIYDQVMDRFFASGDGQAMKQQGKGIPLTDRDVSKVIRIKTAEMPGQIPLRVELKKSADGSPAKVQAPWDGEVVSNTRVDGGKTALTLKHGPSLRSTLIFQGVAAADMQPGAKIEKGRVVGILSPESHSFTWNINKTAGASETGANLASPPSASAAAPGAEATSAEKTPDESIGLVR